jgi:antitoxin component YwqK of YwqJK toxin-antitoxin module
MKCIFFGILFIVSLSGCFNQETKVFLEREVSYFPDSTLKHEVMLKDGKPDGLGISYYASGKVRSKFLWKDGKENGAGIFYYENGKIQQENYYVNGIRRGLSKTYYDNGNLKQLTILDTLGRMMDYYKYDRNGKRILTKASKQPIFLAESDTLKNGETYRAEIRLGNHEFSVVDVFIGEIARDIMLKNKRLPKLDSLTSLLVLKPNTIGLQNITGIIFERNQSGDSVEIIPFEYPIYVRD